MPYIALAFVNLPWCPLSKAGEDDAACQGVLLITRPHSAAIARVVQQAVWRSQRHGDQRGALRRLLSVPLRPERDQAEVTHGLAEGRWLEEDCRAEPQ